MRYHYRITKITPTCTMADKNYDVVVIGAGSGGLTAAVGAVKIGKKVLLIEKKHMGGECTNTGCIPSKALLHHAKTFYAAKKVAGESTKSNAFRADAFSYVRKKIESILKEETPEVFQEMGIDVVFGEAEFNTPCSVTVGEDNYQYHRAIIATGSSPRMITVDGLSSEDILTNQNVFDLEDVPEKTLIIGSGPIGMEMGQAFAMLGSRVTIATIDKELGRLEDDAIRPLLANRCDELGIKVLYSAHIQKVEGHTAYFDIKENSTVLETTTVEFDKVLIAIGRVPNLPKGLEAAGIKYDERCVLVDGQHRTSNKYVYAVGDVSQRLKFTHTADDSARQVITHIASKGILRADTKKAVPKVTYTEPEIAQVGLSHDAANTKYGEESIMRIEIPFSKNDRAKTDNATEGIVVVIARRINGAVLGAHIYGPSAGELIAVFTLAIDQKISMWKLRNTIFAYPVYGLIIKKAGDAFFATQLKDLKKDLFYLFKKHVLKVVVAIVWAIALFKLYAFKESHGMNTIDTSLMIFDFVTMTIWGPIIYILVYAIRPVTFFPATALTILSGIFFGLWQGVLLTILAASLSSAVAYSVGRFFGKGITFENSFIGNWIEALRKNSFSAILTMRLIFLPFDGISYIAGILKVPFVSFLLATFLGTLLGITTFVSIGASLDVEEFRTMGLSFDVIDTKFILISIGVFVISLLLSKFLKRWHAEE